MRKDWQQSDFFDADYLCDELIPQNSFYRRFRDVVGSLIHDAMFASLYCGTNGRPPISPALMAKAMLIQYHMNLSDRELERACMFDIRLGAQTQRAAIRSFVIGGFPRAALKFRKRAGSFRFGP